MMASVFNNPTYQHMVNTNKTKFYPQSDLSNQLDYKLSGNSMCISDIMKRMSPEVSKHLLSAKLPMHAMNWSLMLGEFLPRNQNCTDRSPRRNKNRQYKPVVLRNKTPFAQLSPGILSPQHYQCAEETNTLRLSKAYTLPHNKDTDVLEILPTGDSSMNISEDQDIRSPLSQKILNLLNRVYVQSCLGDFISSLQHAGSSFRSIGLIQFLTNAYYFLYDLIVDIAISLRHATLANAISRLRRLLFFGPIALVSRPLSHNAILNSSQPNSINLQWPPTDDESLSRSAVVSFGRYCNFENLNTVNLRC